MSALSAQNVELWLESNPDWTQNYILNKLDLNLVNRWLLSRGYRSASHSDPNESSLSPSPRTDGNSFVYSGSHDPHSTRIFPPKKVHLFESSGRNESISSGSGGTSPNLSGSDGVFFSTDAFKDIRDAHRSISKKALKQDLPRSKTRNYLRAHEPSFSFEQYDATGSGTLAERRCSLKMMRQFLSLPPSAGSTLSMLIQSKIQLPRYASKNEDFKRELRMRNERDFFHEIVRDISIDLDPSSLIGRILVNVSILVLADWSALYFVEGPKTKQTLVARVFKTEPSDTEDRISTVKLDDSIGNIGCSPWGSGIVGAVAENGRSINLRNASQDARHREDVHRLSVARRRLKFHRPTSANSEDLEPSLNPAQNEACETGPLVCMAICNPDGDVIAVCEVGRNRDPDAVQDGTSPPFSTDDEKLLETYLAFCGMAVSNAQAIEGYTREYDRNKALLEVVHDLFEEQTSVEAVVTKIMQRAQILLKCERCVVMIDENKKSSNHSCTTNTGRLFDLQQPIANGASEHSNNNCLSVIFHHDNQMNKSQISSQDIYLTETQLQTISAVANDRLSGSNVNGILCKPIRNKDFQTIGAAQLINKLDRTSFDENDEELFEVFTIFCGLGINNCLLYDEKARASAKQAVALEVISYHATVPLEQIQAFKCCPVPSTRALHIDSLQFNDFSLNNDEMITAAIRIFTDMGLIKTFKIDIETLIRWLLTVRKNYRNVAYHNWRHAFNVCQTMFTVLESCGMRRHLTDLESLALITACLCHDLDHRGTNNAFQQKSSSALAQLYGTQATLEHHHFNHAVMILNSDGHNIFANLTSVDYSSVMHLLKLAILATDLSLHMQVRKDFFQLVESSDPVWQDCVHRETLRSILMTSCDIGAITKPWETQLKSAQLVLTEFFDQGDKEKEMFNVQPSAIMDRERQSELPMMQIDWIDGICLPLYQSLSKFDNSFQPMLSNLLYNRSQWEALSAKGIMDVENDIPPEESRWSRPLNGRDNEMIEATIPVKSL